MDLTCERRAHDWTSDAGIRRVQWVDPLGRYDGHVPQKYVVEVHETCVRCLATRWITEYRRTVK